MRMRACVIVFAIISLAATILPARAGEVEFSGEIRIGATFPLTGYLESYGLSALLGANTRVRLINAAGGVNGKRLTLLWRDNRSDPQQAVRDVEELTREYGVPAIIGPLLSDSAMAVRPLAEELQVVVLTPMASVDAATHGNK